ncbi:MAG: hypothetical protein CL912_13945 [Deltaproteobacteria bacterium]|nr:hypothetical protein [Deltaproteobacteria bacterium]
MKLKLFRTTGLVVGTSLSQALNADVVVRMQPAYHTALLFLPAAAAAAAALFSASDVLGLHQPHSLVPGRDPRLPSSSIR